MRLIYAASAMCVALALNGCAGMIFTQGYHADGLTFYDPVPHLKVTVAADCTITSEIIALPGRERSVRFVRGIGSSALGVTLANGMIASVNQTTDAKLPETIGAVASLATAAGALAKGGDQKAAFLGPAAGAPPPKPTTCVSEVKIYPLTAGSKPGPLSASGTILNYPAQARQ